MKEEIRKELFKLADVKYKEFNSRLCPGIDNILGVRVPLLRNYAKKLLKKYNFEDIIKNIGNQYFEEIMLQGILIGLYKQKDINILQQYIKKFIPKIDNWAICDTFCMGLKETRKHKEEMWDFIQKYLNSTKEFELRFAIVMVLNYYIEDIYLQKDFEIFNKIQNNQYYVQMAVAWAVSICLVKFYDETIKYLKSDNCNLDKFTFNKSIQKAIESYKLEDDKKQYIKTLKK